MLLEACNPMSSLAANARSNEYVHRYSGDELKKCLSLTKESDEPYGYDPSFVPSSKVYNGKLRAQMFYKKLEFHTDNFPFAFFPHKYSADEIDRDGNGRVSVAEAEAADNFAHSYRVDRDPLDEIFFPNTTVADTLQSTEVQKAIQIVYPKKDPKWIVGQKENSFQLYLDERLTQMQAVKMIDFAEDGKFIDKQTKSIEVSFITYNVPYDVFSTHTVTFDWRQGGKIQYVSQHGSMPASGAATLTWMLFILVVIALLVNTGMELRDVIAAARKYNLSEYICDAFNLIDWSHFIFMWAMAASFIQMQYDIINFTMEERFSVLFYGPRYQGLDAVEKNITVTRPAEARMYRTDAQEEKIFLEFMSKLFSMELRNRGFNLLAGLSFVLFIFRMLKSLNFQARMGLVTRTLVVAASDLFHFLILYGILLYGRSLFLSSIS
jgi:hypothetical protein